MHFPDDDRRAVRRRRKRPRGKTGPEPETDAHPGEPDPRRADDKLAGEEHGHAGREVVPGDDRRVKSSACDSGRARPRGPASGNTPGHVQADTALMPPMTRKARRSASSIGPLGVLDRPARARAGEPSRRDTYGRERPPRRGGGCATPGATPGATPTPSPDRASGQQGGVAPVQSLSAGAARVVRSRTKNTNSNSGKMDAGCATLPPLVLPHSPLCPRGISPALRPALRLTTERRENGGQHQIAASGPVSRTVDHIWKRSIAPRTFVVVGVPSGR